MRFDLKEMVSEPGRAINEDRAGATAEAAWVIDGATGIAERQLLPGPSDARWFAEQIDAAFRALRAWDGETDAILRRAVRAARIAFDDWVRAPVPERIEISGCIVAARLRGDRLELANLGDCVILRSHATGVERFGSSKIEALEADLMCEVARLKRDGVPHDEIWGRVLPIQRRNRALMNHPDGYWVLDLGERGIDHLQVECRPARAGDTVLLMSDGFYRLVEVYARHTNESLIAAARSDGLAALYRSLRRLEDEDSECLSFPRVKARDDATAVMIEIVET